MPDVDVITPVRNGATTLDAAIESVLSQLDVDLEYWIVDDGSTDESASIVEANSDTRLHLLKQSHKGVAAARNAALDRCRSEWVAFLDADDIWLPEKLSRQLEAVGRAPGVGVVCSAAWGFGPGIDGPRRLPARARSGNDTFEDLLRGNFVILSSVMARREELAAAGAFDVTENLRVGEDYDLWLRMAARGTRFLFLDEPTLRYRVAPGSATSNPKLVASQTLGILAGWESRADPGQRRAIAAHREELLLDLCYELRARGDLSGAGRALARLLPTGLARARVWGEAAKLAWCSLGR